MANPPDKDQYKDTVFLPKTDFPMRGELPKKEPEILKMWQDMDFYTTQRLASRGRPKWVLHWGPPYANGHAHMGHAFTKSLKDVVNRSWQMLGYDAPLVPGWDCHGLPIEWKIEEKYRAAAKNSTPFNKDEVDPLTFRAECRAFADGWIATQSKEFERLGVNADWKNPYKTMSHQAEAQIVREIHKFAMNGGLYKGVKPVMWSVVEKTALAEAEVEYKEHKSITVWVKFPVIHTAHKPLESASVVIWTTTPWSLPANRAIAFGDAIDYALYEVREVVDGSKAKIGDRLLLAIKLADAVKAAAKITVWEEEVTFKGADLAGLVCRHPLRGQGYDYDVPLLPGDHVTDDAGTGFVHIAPEHGADDFYLGQKFGIEITECVMNDGTYRADVPLFAGMAVYTQKGEIGDGNFAIIKAIDETGGLLAKGSIKHEYPHSWRSKAPIIFRTTPQWFIAMDGEGRIREKALKAIDATRWIPEKGQNRIRAMVAQRPDWCISRQRLWGVPIALFIDRTTGAMLKDPAVFTRIADAFEKEGADAWWLHDAQFFLGPDYDAAHYDQVFDTCDVWFDSASTHAFVLEARPELKWPADLYLEGSDQHRGWFHTSLLESCGTRGRAPYDTVLTHGFVLDEKGYKMSKSLGNVVDPADMIAQYGADIIRLWALLSDYSEDIRIGKDTLKLTADLYRRIRNTFRYLLGALDGFTLDEKLPEAQYGEMPELERLVLHWLFELDAQVRGHIQNYEFGRLAHTLHNFCALELSSFYFDIRKDRLYCDRADSFDRRACRTVMAQILSCLTAWLAPILAFTTEEAWSHRPAGFTDETSVHLRTFPDLPVEWRDEELSLRWSKIREIRFSVTRELEILRADKIIGSSLEASVPFSVDRKRFDDIGEQNWPEIFITSQAQFNWFEATEETHEFEEDGIVVASTNTIKVFAKPADGEKCVRCWKILPEVGSNSQHLQLCARCADAVGTQIQRAA